MMIFKDKSLYWFVIDKSFMCSVMSMDKLKVINSFHVDHIDCSKKSDTICIWILNPSSTKFTMLTTSAFANVTPAKFPKLLSFLNGFLTSLYPAANTAHVLSSQVSLVLKANHSLFNKFSSFFCLRYSSAVFSYPNYYEKRVARISRFTTSSVQFTQLLQLSFKLAQMLILD